MMNRKIIIIVAGWILAVILLAPIQLRLAHVGLAQGPEVIDELSQRLSDGPYQFGSASNDVSLTIGRADIELLTAYKQGEDSVWAIRKRHIILLKAMLIAAPFLFLRLGYAKRKETDDTL
jgi:hypothetical protein